MKPSELFAAHERGEKIEAMNFDCVWKEWDGLSWDADVIYRIAPKPDVTFAVCIAQEGVFPTFRFPDGDRYTANVDLVFSGDTGELKEVRMRE